MKDKNRKIFGFILILIGVILISRTFGIFFFDIGDFFSALFPLAIICLGIWLMIRRKRMDDKLKEKYGSAEQEIKVSFHTQDDGRSATIETKVNDFAHTQSDSAQAFTKADYDSRSTKSPKVDDSGKIKYDKFIGDIFIDLNNVNPRNIEVSMFVGDTELKIHGAILSDGLNRIIISSFIGDIRIFTPKDMAVFVHCSNFIGAIDALNKHTSGLGNNIEAQTKSYESAVQKLYIACNSFIGDIRVIEI